MDLSRLTPLVGRHQEIATLQDRWERAQEGDGQAVLISGEAGVGKSRVLHAFREQLAEVPHIWLECHCSPLAQGSAFHPLAEFIHQGVGLEEHEPPEEKLHRLERAIQLVGLPVPEMVPLVAPLLSLPLPDRYPSLQFSPELRRRKTIEALVTWVLALSRRQPLVVLVEDLHWCDPSTTAFLGELLAESRAAPVCTLLSFRPNFEPLWPARSPVTQPKIGRLRRRQAEQLVHGVTGGRSLPGELVERIVERADGVPLFLEELTKMVLEAGHQELAIPATLQDSLMARLDRLGGRRKWRSSGQSSGASFRSGCCRPSRHSGCPSSVRACDGWWRQSCSTKRGLRRIPRIASSMRWCATAPTNCC